MEQENLEKNEKAYFSEVRESAGLATGPGGQNVNKRATKIELRWRANDSAYFGDEEKALILERLRNRINKEGELIVSAQKERSQSRNREIAYEKLHELIQEALRVEPERILTKPSMGEKEKRIRGKKYQGAKKELRQKPAEEE